MKAERKTADEDLCDAIMSNMVASKDYQTLVDDGVAVERLLKNPDFNRYQKLLTEAAVLLVRRIEEARDQTELPGLQGALRQHFMMLRLPQKVLDVAERMVQSEREDREQVEAK